MFVVNVYENNKMAKIEKTLTLYLLHLESYVISLLQIFCLLFVLYIQRFHESAYGLFKWAKICTVHGKRKAHAYHW